MFPIEDFRNTLEKIVALLRQLEIRFHLTGGVTAVAYSEPRLTQDIDIVVDQSAMSERLEDFVVEVHAAGFLTDDESIRSAVRRGGLFQLIDEVETLKVDLYAREMIPGELNRSIHVEILTGLSVPICSLSDAAASKLMWVHKGSHKGRRDVRRLYEHATPGQQQLIRQLAEEIGLADLLQTVLSESDEPME